jgi:dTDP-4-amino-4,6-dideoxygalactose transaminase
MSSKIWLSKPHFENDDVDFFKKIMESNWISTVGPHIGDFEKSIEKFYHNKVYVAALNSGTSAIHLALKMLDIGAGDEVICQTFTYCATVNPILYCGSTPIFVGSEKETWNMCPNFLEEAIKNRLKKNKKPKAIIVVDSYGMSAKWDELLEISNRYEIPIIEDAAEALGSVYKGKLCGNFGDYSILSFNGNKIITTSSGGALLCRSKKDKERAIYLSTQAKIDDANYGDVGFNFRMSNVLAGLGLQQLKVVEKRIEQRRLNHHRYSNLLSEMEGVELQQEYSKDFYSNFWLNCITTDHLKISKLDLLEEFTKNHIDVRSLWNPLHLQSYLKGTLYFGDNLSETLFQKGLCLPSSSNLTDEEFDRIAQVFNSFKM